MKLIAEKAVSAQLKPVLDKLKGWGIQLYSTEWVDDIKKSGQFDAYDNGKQGEERQRVIVPKDLDTIFSYFYGNHKEDTVGFAGATFPDGKPSTLGDRISVIYWGNEPGKVAELRFVHEYCHAEELPADDLQKHYAEFLKGFDLQAYEFLKGNAGENLKNAGWVTKIGISLVSFVLESDLWEYDSKTNFNPEQMPYFQEKYYRWLFGQRKKGKMRDRVNVNAE